MPKIVFGVAVLTALYLVASGSVLACSCLKKGNWIEREFGTAEVVFVGEVEEIGETHTKRYSYPSEGDYLGYSSGPNIETAFRVTEIFKGESSANAFRHEGSLFIRLATGPGTAACGAPAFPGATLLVFGFRNKNGYLKTSFCSSSRVDVPEHIRRGVNRQIEILRKLRDSQPSPNNPLEEDAEGAPQLGR